MTRRAILAAVLGAALVAACGVDLTGQPYYDPAKPHHTPSGFRNLPGSPARDVSFSDRVAFFWHRLTWDYDPSILPDHHVVPPDEALRAMKAAPADARLTWIGHATFLIGYGGLNILTDPFFSERASPFSFAGPKRFVPPGIALDDLPKIDVILISHNHYDSFDNAALERLAAKFPDVLVLAPLGNGEPLRALGFKNVPDMDWYDKIERGGVTFEMTPGIHWANRTPWDVGKTLWGGFTITGSGPKIWFAGDTAIGPVFKDQIAPKIAPVDIALVPIGAFLPRNFMRAVHVTPEEAVELARIMGAKVAVANHWGTLPLGNDLPREGRDRFLAAKVDGLRNVIMRIGETLPLEALR